MRIVFGIGIGFDRCGNPIADHHAEDCIREATGEACERFGGCFVTRGEGAWKDGNGKLVIEPGITFTIEGEHARERLHEFARYLADLFNQSAILVSVSGSKVDFVTHEEISCHVESPVR